jgi:phosphatidylglycerophosphate synthase
MWPMSLQTDPKKTVPENNNLATVLVLSDPPSPFKARDWYWKTIAGEPFLLRNILNIQRSGVERLLIFSRENRASVEALCQKARDDSRVLVELECVFESERLVTSLKSEGGVLFLDGSVLNSKAGVDAARQPECAEQQKTSGSFFMDPENLQTLVENSEDQSLLTGLNHFLLEKTTLPGEIYPEGAFKVVLADQDKSWRVVMQDDFARLGDRLIQTSGLCNDSFMDRNFTRHISRYLTRQCVRTSVTPNQLTLVSLAVGLEAAVCFLYGGYGMSVFGAGLLLLSASIDCTDGEIARLKYMESQFGKRLDIICDNLVHIAVFFAIGMGLYGSTDKSLFILLGSLAVFGSLICFILLSPKIMSSKSQGGQLKKFLDCNKDLVDRLANRDFTYLLFFMALLGSLDIFIGLTALGANAFAGYLLYSKFKSVTEQNQNLSGN